ncbi:tol-pal system protein YbgF [Cognatazoarcus halotolerans]|uniref:tol-pal system protein YbgF n=1 Tax=Cognatazoarcus halotolerans TaxID=2686016 RepID=UPI00135A334C|nr:tol-pal system protein YbgF [Cognatazoarcus halotolerans]MBX3680178.1 tol-pal system protein YbgF [Rhodocyclaceae bacterium]MCB1902421.1 tol-pal system protein YbgF [Rhodocyclaceae bacterium]MCP5307848.1 tol-pal system protein YbgF [Zoogloeaceae bacterium]
MSRALAAASLVALLLPAAMPAAAGVFDDTEARKEIVRIRDAYGQRLDRLEAGSQAQLELSNQLETMKSEIAKLRGQVEVLTYKLDSIEKRQKDFYVDLDNRLRQIETRSQPAASKPVDPAAEARDYQAALDLLKAGKYAEAGDGFEKFTQSYPASSFLPSANFWAGSAWYQAREVAKAGDYYRKVESKWPDDPRAPDALLGLANSQQAMGDAKGARSSLEALLSRYPDSSAAQMAKQRLGKK